MAVNGAPAVHRPADLLTRQRIEVRAEGESVVLVIGNAEMKMNHETAFTLSAWLRLRGAQAKNAAGDTRRLTTVLGHLHDVAAR